MQSKGFRGRSPSTRTIGTLIVALEGEASGKEYRYFDAVKKALASHKPHWLRIVPLPTPPDTHASAPRWVIQRLDDYVTKRRRNREFSSSDMLWLIFDVDTWEQQELSAVCKAAAQKQYEIATSNPCFELWLILHLERSDPQMIAEVLEGALMEKTNRRSQRMKQLLAEHASPSDYHALANGASIGRAILRSEALIERSTPSSTARWPGYPGTFVHRIFRDLEHQGFLPAGWLLSGGDAKPNEPSESGNP